MMERNVYEIYEMFAHLSLEQKKGVLRDFQEMVDAEESRPEESYLEQKWKDIEDLLYDLSRVESKGRDHSEDHGQRVL